MLKIRNLSYFILIFFLLTAGAFAQDADLREYQVVKGDTLWDISKAQLKDPFLWPSVWKENPQIANPNRIYPDQKIRIPLAGRMNKKDEGESVTSSAPETKVPPAAAAQSDQTVTQNTSCNDTRNNGTAVQESSATSGRLYPGLQGVELYDGTVIRGQILFLSAEIVTVRTPDDKVASYSVAKDVANFLKE